MKSDPKNSPAPDTPRQTRLTTKLEAILSILEGENLWDGINLLIVAQTQIMASAAEGGDDEPDQT